ncbi:MAG: helix-turn-helix transcriptional regulator, partial [Bacillota bacterium]
MSEKLNERNKQIKRLQQNLSSIRKIAGWTAEVLGEKIGVSKQTISNIENNKSTMNFSQYIAIRSIFDAEIANNKENELLPKVIAILLDSEDEINEDDYSKIQDVVETVAATAAGGT